MKNIELPIEHAEEYDAAAEWCAIRGLTGEIGCKLPPNMGTEGALLYINSDPDAFADRVRQFRYSIAMEKHSTY